MYQSRVDVPRGNNQFYSKEKEEQETGGYAMMLKTERNSYHTRCAGVYVHVYVGVRTSIVTNLCKGQCPIVAVRGEFVSPICPSRDLAPITVTLPLLFPLALSSRFRLGNRINAVAGSPLVFGERPSVSGNSPEGRRTARLL